jgi:hypothetical protein
MTHRPLVLSALLCCATIGCFGPKTDSAEDSAPPDTTDQPPPNALDDSHDGWRDPSCWGCHDTDTTHNSGMDPYQCVSCHDSNGARPGHTDLTPCAECHQQPHAPTGFPDPASCLTCHPR